MNIRADVLFKRGWPITALVLSVFVAGCGSQQSPEEQVRAVIEQMELAAEARNVGDVVALLSPQYRDAHGNGPEEVGRAVRGYFIANQSIHLLTRIEDIAFPQADEARATVLVGMAGREADTANAWNLAADLYEFEIALIRDDGDWKITWAQWKRN